MWVTSWGLRPSFIYRLLGNQTAALGPSVLLLSDPEVRAALTCSTVINSGEPARISHLHQANADDMLTSLTA